MNRSSDTHRLLAIPLLALVLAGGAHGASPSAAHAWTDDFAAGRKAIDARDWKAASESFGRVVEQDARNADAYELLGHSLRWQSRFDEAVRAYEKALALDPSYKGICEAC